MKPAPYIVAGEEQPTHPGAVLREDMLPVLRIMQAGAGVVAGGERELAEALAAMLTLRAA